MRRTLYLLAVVVASAASPASAQARAVTIARLLPLAEGTRSVDVHVSNLLDDPEWVEQWRSAYVIQIHWKVQLWKKVFLGIASPLPPVEWDVYLQQVPGIDLFYYTQRIAGETTRSSFGTLDSLKAEITKDIRIRGPRPLAAGSYYFLIDARLSSLAEDPLDPRNAPDDRNAFQRLVGALTGGGITRDLPQVMRDFKVP